ncbi:MAG: MFS transporter [Candidatus Latescibacteria bacterium]|nr:MFS transporter [Candidatus Latescibacterota bacterium]
MWRSLFYRVDVRRFSRNAQFYFAFSILYSSGMSLFSLLYNLYLLRLGYREDFIGLLAGMTPLTSGLFAIPIGMGSDRWGRKPFMAAASLLLAFSQVGLCLITHSTPLLILGLLSGISPAMVYVNHVPYLSENSRPEDRGTVISLAFSTYIITAMVMSLVGGNLPRWIGGWMGVGLDRPEPFRYALMFGSAITALSILPALRMREARPSREALPKEAVPSSPVPVPWGILLIFAATSALRGLGMGLSFPFFNVFFEESIHASTRQIGLLFFCARFVSMPSAVVSPGITRRFGPVPALFSLRMISGLSLAVLGATDHLLLALGIFLIYSIAESMATPQEMIFATNQVSRAYWGRGQSLRVTGFQLSAAVGSVMAGRMIVSVGYGLTFGLAAVAVFGSAILLLSKFGWHYRE